MLIPKHLVVLCKAMPVLAIASLSLLANAHAAQTTASDAPDSLANLPSGTYFRPPSNPKPRSGPRTSTGTRDSGCLGATETAFTLLGPDAEDDVIGRTTSSHPTFVWHLPETDNGTLPVIFRVLAPDTDNIPIPIYQTTLGYTAGTMSHQLPVTETALAAGTEYRWQVIVECNPEYPAQALVQERSFEVISPSETLSQALSASTTASDRAVAYGQAGVWYDAIAQVAQATNTTDEATRQGLLTDLASSLPEEKDQLRQDILLIVEATDSF
ncbi:MAG: DUF928 domain-containing protein [Leptolyngbya sp. SIO3F4]|nr:DUF928 domain-containing protein [Leptolyngbya sp. SIO3F4]